MHGTLYIIATPIGNLEDSTLRAIRILGEVDTIFCEDTRITKRILEKYDINTTLVSLNARTEERKLGEVTALLEEGKSIAYVSDAGTPGISDPGVRLVARARAAGARVETIPGASALTAALSIAGIPTDTFTFYGFLPQKKGRQTVLKEISALPHTAVFYESTHRILKLLGELHEHTPHKHVYLARELTKIHEETLHGTAEELAKILTENPVKQKGEFVVAVYKPHKI